MGQKREGKGGRGEPLFGTDVIFSAGILTGKQIQDCLLFKKRYFHTPNNGYGALRVPSVGYGGLLGLISIPGLGISLPLAKYDEL